MLYLNISSALWHHKISILNRFRFNIIYSRAENTGVSVLVALSNMRLTLTKTKSKFRHVLNVLLLAPNFGAVLRLLRIGGVAHH